jgi:Tfp pilus assembly protein PilX
MRTTMLRRQSSRGVVLLTTMLILVVVLLGAVALVRSFDTSLTMAGNLSFKRDLAQQSELAAETILSQFRPGGPMETRATRQASNAGIAYSASVQPNNLMGFPAILLTFGKEDPRPAGVGSIDAGRDVKLAYVVDRLCSEPGDEQVLGSDKCVTAGDSGPPSGGSTSLWRRAEQGSSVAAGGAGSGLAGAVTQTIVYRISIRAFGPRGTESFFQTTYGCCDN